MNRNLLKAKIVENGITMDKLANLLDMNRVTLYAKMAGKSQFSIEEVIQACNILGIESAEEKVKIFLS